MIQNYEINNNLGYSLNYIDHLDMSKHSHCPWKTIVIRLKYLIERYRYYEFIGLLK